MINFDGYLVLGMASAVLCFVFYVIWSYTRLRHSSMKAFIEMLAINVLILSALAYIVIDHAYSLSTRQSLAVLDWLLVDFAVMTIIYWWTVARVKTKEQHIRRWFSTGYSIIMPAILFALGFPFRLFH